MRFAWALVLAGCGFRAQPAGPDTMTGPVVDAEMAFDVASCPASYDAVLPGPTRYRLIATAAHVDVQIAACNADLPGRTHLVVFESLPELVAVSGFVDGQPAGSLGGDSIWIGGVQLRTAALPHDGWLGFDDQPLLDQWAAPGEPNDGGGGEDQQEQFASLKRTRRYFSDSSRTSNDGALCECDGNPVAPMAAAAITANLP